MSHPLGEHISAEVARAEADLSGLRSRGQSVLTMSSGLVAVLGAVLAFAVGDSSLTLDGLTKAAAGAALVAFFVATVFVIFMFVPKDALAVDPTPLQDRIDSEWEAAGWDRTVARAEVTYLGSLTMVNRKLANLLLAAIIAQVVGVAAVCLMALSLLAQG